MIKVERQQVLESTHSGGVCFNEAVFHVAQDDLPFWGRRVHRAWVATMVTKVFSHSAMRAPF